MLGRKITKSLKEWYENGESALLVDGARQVGKTTAIKEFLKSSNIKYIEFNLFENKLALEAFNTAKDQKQLIFRLMSLSGKSSNKNTQVIFIDEIQEADDAITPIKFLVQNTEYKFIFSGSLLGIKMREILSVPVGFLSSIQMYPMDFEEFARSLDVSEDTFSYLKKCFDESAQVDEIVHKQMIDLFNIYLVVGGMPKAVAAFKETKNIARVNTVLRDIDFGYKQDIVKYQKDKSLLIEEIYDLIPSELNSQNKRFILKNLNENARFYKYETSFIWLKNSGVGLFVHNVDNPVYPLLASKERTLFKLFTNDVGLLTYKLFNGNQTVILNGNCCLNYGAVYEAVVAEELKTHGFELFYNSDKKRGEIDFLAEENNKVIPIEVKSGKDYKRHSALSQLMKNESFNYEKGYVFCNGNLEVVDKVTYLPIYMVMFLNNEAKNVDQIINFDISKLI